MDERSDQMEEPSERMEESVEEPGMQEALALFSQKEYARALPLFDRLARAGDKRAQLYQACCRFLIAQPGTPDLLRKTWDAVRPLLEQGVEGEDPFLFAEETRRALALCTTALYRACNDRQMVEFTLLKKDVSFENKEYVLSEFQRLLNAADEDYRAVLTVIYEYAAYAMALPGERDKAFSLGLLQYMRAAVSLQAEIGLSEEFDPLILAKYACHLILDPEMEEAAKERNRLLADALKTPDALKDWDLFAPFAEEAGVSREALEKQARKRERREKLKFWKKYEKKEEA